MASVSVEQDNSARNAAFSLQTTSIPQVALPNRPPRLNEVRSQISLLQAGAELTPAVDVQKRRVATSIGYEVPALPAAPAEIITSVQDIIVKGQILWCVAQDVAH